MQWTGTSCLPYLVPTCRPRVLAGDGEDIEYESVLWRPLARASNSKRLS